MEFDLEYEQLVKDLFDELIELLQKRYHILFKMLSSDDKKVYRKVFKEEQYSLLKDLQKVTTKALNVIEDIDKTFSSQIPFKEPKEIDERIQGVTDRAIPARKMFSTLEKEGKLSEEEVSRNEDLGSNMKVMANKIEEYNSNFEEKLLTFKQARKNHLKDLNENVFADI